MEATSIQKNDFVHWAAAGGRRRCIVLGSDHAPQLAQKLNRGRETALHVAAQHGRETCYYYSNPKDT